MTNSARPPRHPDDDIVIPPTLDALIRRNRDRVQIRLASVSELERFAGEITEEPSRTLSQWWTICIAVDGNEGFGILGHNENVPMATFMPGITAVDLDEGVVLAGGRAHRVTGVPQECEPDGFLILAVALWLSEHPTLELLVDAFKFG